MRSDRFRFWLRRAGAVLWDDFRRFYGRRNLLRLVIGFSIGALLANSPLDQWLTDCYQQRVHSDSPAAKQAQRATKRIGDCDVVVTAPLVATAIGLLAPANPMAATVGTWGLLYIRGFVAATPLAYGCVWLLGGDRPKAGEGSAWQPWRGKQKGISGHAMAGSLPFLVMAGMTSNPYGQAVCYLCSGFTAWSRLDTQAHYPSQIFLGWWLSFLAVRVVRKARKP